MRGKGKERSRRKRKITLGLKQRKPQCQQSSVPDDTPNNGRSVRALAESHWPHLIPSIVITRQSYDTVTLSFAAGNKHTPSFTVQKGQCSEIEPCFNHA